MNDDCAIKIHNLNPKIESFFFFPLDEIKRDLYKLGHRRFSISRSRNSNRISFFLFSFSSLTFSPGKFRNNFDREIRGIFSTIKGRLNKEIIRSHSFLFHIYRRRYVFKLGKLDGRNLNGNFE